MEVGSLSLSQSVETWEGVESVLKYLKCDEVLGARERESAQFLSVECRGKERLGVLIQI